jgi:hypothetical protein
MVGSKGPVESSMNRRLAILVTTRWVAMTWIASDLEGLGLKARMKSAPVTRVPQVVARVRSALSGKSLRAALWIANCAALVFGVTQAPPRVTTSRAAVSATRCSLRFSRYSRPLSTTTNRNNSAIPRVIAPISPIAPRWRTEPGPWQTILRSFAGPVPAS